MLFPRLYDPALSTNHFVWERNQVQIQLHPTVALCKELGLQGGRKRHVSALKFRPCGQKVTDLLIATDQILFGEGLAGYLQLHNTVPQKIPWVGIYIYKQINIVAVALLAALVSYQAE